MDKPAMHTPSLKPKCISLLAIILALGLEVLPDGKAFPQTAPQPVLARRYQTGEKLRYKMEGTNQGHSATTRYTAQASGLVEKNQSGIFVEEFRWSGLNVNNRAVALSPASQQFREYLSLSPDYTLSIPDFSKVQPILIGPIADLLTFYADVQLAMRQPGLVHAGDHVYIKHGTPNSWADGTDTLIGQDAVDFDITLKSIDHAEHLATLVIRHVPPAHPQITLPAEWMRTPVSGTANNWVEVEKLPNGNYSAEVGKETFVDEIKIALSSGRIISASMDNPIEVLERNCSDPALTVCSASSRYQIKRQISLKKN